MGFCQVKKNSKNLRKTRKWVGGSSPNSHCLFFGIFFLFVFRVVFMFPNVSKKIKIGWGGGCVLSDQSEFFSDFLIFFDKTPLLRYILVLI